jgi:hypothetical protein
MAQVRETRAFEPLCAICTQGDRIDQLIGDGVTENLSCILARVYNGDPAPLKKLIEAVTADEFTRDAALGSLAWLTAAGQIDRKQTANYLRDLYVQLQPQTTSQVWLGWQQAIAFLGLHHLAPLVENAFNRRLIDERAMHFDHFENDLRDAMQAALPTAPFAHHMRLMDAHDDAVALLSTWHAFQPQGQRKAPPATASILSQDRKHTNDLFRDVGRNAPCPCGSGKKFKKCCLGKAA